MPDGSTGPNTCSDIGYTGLRMPGYLESIVVYRIYTSGLLNVTYCCRLLCVEFVYCNLSHSRHESIAFNSTRLYVIALSIYGYMNYLCLASYCCREARRKAK